MQILAYTISPMSWRFLSSAIQRVCKSKNSVTPIDFNLEAPPCAILCCIALEAFVNEISGSTNALLFEEKKEHQAGHSTLIQQEADRGMALVNCQNIGKIKDDSTGSFYERYKNLLKATAIEKPNCMPRLIHLRDLRDALVHFRACEIPIVEDQRGVIRSEQEPPEVFNHLKSYKVNGWPVVDTTTQEDWTLRASTNAMAVWSLRLVLGAITHVIDNLPAGKYREFILRRYASGDDSFSNVFEMGKTDVAALAARLSEKS